MAAVVVAAPLREAAGGQADASPERSELALHPSGASPRQLCYTHRPPSIYEQYQMNHFGTSASAAGGGADINLVVAEMRSSVHAIHGSHDEDDAGDGNPEKSIGEQPKNNRRNANNGMLVKDDKHDNGEWY